MQNQPKHKTSFKPYLQENKIQYSPIITLDALLIPYAGMNRHDLLLFSKKAAWQKMRIICSVSLVCVWLTLLSAICIQFISISYCKSMVKWWHNSVIYEIYPRSFQDSNGDGVGDIPGITSRLDYFTYLGIDAIWITPIYTSPMKDFGYDIANYTDIDPLFGTIEDYKILLKEAHKKNIKIIMDFVPNHTSNKHRWFNLSCQEVEPYTDYYVWKNGKLGEDGRIGPPNNWLSEFGGSGWTWNSQRSQFYYHNFLKEQPDLNYENPLVLEEMKNVLRFWLDLGVDGFRMDAVTYVHEDQNFLDEPINKEANSAASDEYKYLEHIYVKNQPKTMETIREFVKVIRSYETPDTIKLIMIEDYNTPPNLMPYYDMVGADFPFNFGFISSAYDDATSTVNGPGGLETYHIVFDWMKYMVPDLKPITTLNSNHNNTSSLQQENSNNVNIVGIKSILTSSTPENSEEILSSKPNEQNETFLQSSAQINSLTDANNDPPKHIDYTKRWPNWVTGNHDRSRVASRFGENMADAINMLILLLPGTPTIYYGDELGMQDIDIPPFTQTQDTFAINMGPERYRLYTRDPERSPMQWSSEPMAGFSAANFSWLPVNPDYTHKNVETQKNVSESHLNIFRKLMKLRKNPEFQTKNLAFGPCTEHIFTFVRSMPLEQKGKPNQYSGYLIILNLGREPDIFPNLSGSILADSKVSVGKPLTLVLKTPNVSQQSESNNEETNNVSNGNSTEFMHHVNLQVGSRMILIAQDNQKSFDEFENVESMAHLYEIYNDPPLIASMKETTSNLSKPLHKLILNPGDGYIFGWGH